MKDSSQNSVAINKLLQSNEKEQFIKYLREKQYSLQEKHNEKRRSNISLDKAKENRINLF